MKLRKGSTLALALLFVALTVSLIAQETTGGLQGTVKDDSGAVVPNATISLTGSNLVGTKSQTSDSNGYYRFANLPPGTYALTVAAKGFISPLSSGAVFANRSPT